MTGAVLPFRAPPSPREALAQVRRRAEHSRNIAWTEHALDRMDEREITSRQALRTIREGDIADRLVPDGEDEWKVTLKKRDAGRAVHVVVALSGDEDLSVVTVY